MSSLAYQIRFIGIDDNQLDLFALSEYTKAHPLLENCGTFNNAIAGFEAQQYVKPDLIFLDIEMPGISGIELLRKIRSEVPMAVIITSHPEFALEGFELSVLDYILKPLTPERLDETVRRISEYWEMKQKSLAYEVMFETETLTIREGYNQVKLPQQEIIYLEAMQDYTKIVTHRKNYMTLSSITYFMEQLPRERFLRVHRSYAVALDRVSALQKNEVTCGNFKIPVGKTYKSVLSQIKLS